MFEYKDFLIDVENFVVNIGPQHPSTHGVLRIVVQLDGETVVHAEPIIGYLHTSMEKYAEFRTYHQAETITDRMDYVSGASNNLGYILTVEKLCGVKATKRAEYVRVILAELTRISSHLVWLGTHAVDLGALTEFLYCFRERELVLDLIETLTGARMTPSFFRVGGLAKDIHKDFVEKTRDFIKIFPEKINQYEALLTNNKIWFERTKNVGIISKEDAVNFALTGPCLRGSGLKYDVRKINPYSSYEDFDFDIPIGDVGDVYDRYIVRMEEMRQSLKIVHQALENIPDGEYLNYDAYPLYVIPPKKRALTTMEGMISLFKYGMEGIKPPKGEAYVSIENPRGELGYYMISDGSAFPYRMRVRPPSFCNVSALNKMAKGHLLADLVSILGSIDILLGEIDR
ncbi:MAG: NADH-quinone oxidoreductase subunit D [Candidatus Acididesulfobacter guangdongensis]|uniref:NADH-quinone oxidoreductase subunit D n=1 Tax=Acididesulfobacter guangdongensis TaxID=2597225 RepID=A0A519BI30_ACIG2|nr:MAG: NADH-quinone oxidoreductase subunit D [Candidatus Acididesulfobacter guangdongensis]